MSCADLGAGEFPVPLWSGVAKCLAKATSKKATTKTPKAGQLGQCSWRRCDDGSFGLSKPDRSSQHALCPVWLWAGPWWPVNSSAAGLLGCFGCTAHTTMKITGGPITQLDDLRSTSDAREMQIDQILRLRLGLFYLACVAPSWPTFNAAVSVWCFCGCFGGSE